MVGEAEDVVEVVDSVDVAEEGGEGSKAKRVLETGRLLLGLLLIGSIQISSYNSKEDVQSRQSFSPYMNHMEDSDAGRWTTSSINDGSYHFGGASMSRQILMTCNFSHPPLIPLRPTVSAIQPQPRSLTRVLTASGRFCAHSRMYAMPRGLLRISGSRSSSLLVTSIPSQPPA